MRVRAHYLWGLIRRRDSEFVTGHLRGLRGVEIGASAHNRYFLDAINVDRFASMETPYKREERRLALHRAKVDVVAPGDDRVGLSQSGNGHVSASVIPEAADNCCHKRTQLAS